MKILFVLDYYVPHVGWAETLFRNVIERLAKKGHQIKVLTCRHNADVPAHEAMGANIEVYRVGSGRFDLMWHALGKTGRTLAQEADVIHTTTYSAAVPASILWVFFQKRTVITVHEVFWKLWYRFMGWKGFFHKAFERAVFLLPFDAYLCVSNYTKNSLRLLFWLPDDKLSTVYNGIDTEFWDASKTDAGLASRIRAELGLEKAFSTLYFGRPGVSKGLEYFLEAIPLVCQKIPHFKAVCIVSGDDAERVAVMKRKIAELGIADRVIWKGAVPYGELREYLMAADSVIVPSLVEGFWFSAAEASALWRPLVYSNAAALPEVVFGTTVPAEPGNSADIARAIVDLSEGKTVQVARKVFGWEENVEKTERAYQNPKAETFMKNSIYDNEPEAYSQLRRWWMFDEKLSIISNRLETKKIHTFLDFWSWTWDFIYELACRFPNIKFIGYDVNEVYVNDARKRFQKDNLSFAGNLNSLVNERIDFAYVNDVIHHFPTESDFFDAVSILKVTEYFIIEPNQFHPYIAYAQATMPGERNFSQKNFEKSSKERWWILLNKEYLFIFPNSIKRLHRAYKKMNDIFQDFFLFWGAVSYSLKKRIK